MLTPEQPSNTKQSGVKRCYPLFAGKELKASSSQDGYKNTINTFKTIPDVERTEKC